MDIEEDIHPLLPDKSVLDCPICVFPLTIPVYQCENGHIICSSCLKRLTKPQCPSCSLENLGKIRNRAIEHVLESVTVFCAYRSSGCTAGRLTFDAKRLHEITCAYAPYKCPYFNDCKFMGSPAQLHKHAKKVHHNLCVPIRVLQFSYKKKVRYLFVVDDDGRSVFVLDTRTMEIYSIRDSKETPPLEFGGSLRAKTEFRSYLFQPITVICCCANDADWNGDYPVCDDAVILDIIFKDCDKIFIQIVVVDHPQNAEWRS